MRIALNLPRTTHRNLIEIVSGCRHLNTTLAIRFISFIDNVRSSKKLIPKMLLSTIMNDTRSITGLNLRNTMLVADKDNVKDLTKCDAIKVKYHQLNKDEEWKKHMLLELLEVRDGDLEIANIEESEICEMIDFICTG